MRPVRSTECKDRGYSITTNRTKRIAISAKSAAMQFRVDSLNAFNRPNFQPLPNNAGNTDVWGNTIPTTALTAAGYNTWATAHNQPDSTTAAGAALRAQINNMVNGAKVERRVASEFLQLVPPKNFYCVQATVYDITTLQGFKLSVCARHTTRTSVISTASGSRDTSSSA